MDELQKLSVTLKAAIESMSAEEKRQLALSLCAAVDELSKTIVQNADALWQMREQQA